MIINRERNNNLENSLKGLQNLLNGVPTIVNGVTYPALVLTQDQKNVLENVVIPTYKQAKKEIREMERSTQKFAFKRDLNLLNNTGSNYYDVINNELVIAFGNLDNANSLPLVAHETLHAYQFIKGKVSYKRNNTPNPGLDAGSLYDITDEVEAYERQYIFAAKTWYGEIDMNLQPHNNFQVNTALVLQMGLQENPPIYQNIPQNNINLSNVGAINSYDEIYFNQ